MKLKKVRGYIFSRSFMGERAPQHVQNLVIRDYCKKNNLLYLLSSTEYAMKNCHLMLEQVLDELKSKPQALGYNSEELVYLALANGQLIVRDIIEKYQPTLLADQKDDEDSPSLT